MRKIIISLLASLFVVNANSEILSVDVEKGTSIVKIKWVMMATGCGGILRELPVIYSADIDAFVKGRNVNYKPISLSDFDHGRLSVNSVLENMSSLKA